MDSATGATAYKAVPFCSNAQSMHASTHLTFSVGMSSGMLILPSLLLGILKATYQTVRHGAYWDRRVY